MRTLKKALCLVLVLAMVFTLAVPALAVDKAQDYTDYSTVTSKEAVDVLTAIGVLHGNTDGTFGPNGNFTRAQAATIIAYMMLGTATADVLPKTATEFSDVPMTHWASSYIQYCVDQGIIHGYGNGQFGPDDVLTSYQWALMLLGALGYDAANEGIGGAGWEIKTTQLAVSKGVASASQMTGTFNRDVAAAMALNTIKATLVEYTGNGLNITVGDTTITTANSVATAVTSDVAKEQTINRTEKISNNGGFTVQFGEKYFPKLTLTSGTDAFERPANVWTFEGKQIGTYAEEATLTYTTRVTSGTIYSDLLLNKAVTADVYKDGASATAYTLSSKNTTPIGGTGILTQVYENDGNVTIVEIKTYVGDVTAKAAETNSRDAYVTITGRGDHVSGRYTTTEFNRDDVVIYNYSYKTGEAGIYNVSAANTVTGTLTYYNTGVKATVGGTSYTYNANIATQPSSVGYDVTVVLDAYGNAIDVANSKTATNYAVVLKYANNGDYWNDVNVAQLLLTDGTVVDKALLTATSDSGLAEGDIVSYTVNAKGNYTLTRVAGANTLNGSSTGSTKYTVDIKNGDYTVDSIVNSTAVIADGTTLFLVKTTDADGDAVYTLYNGIKNVPSIKTTTAAIATVYAKSNNIATVVYVDASGATITTDVKNVIYVAGKATVGASNDSELGTYYQYSGIVNGEITTEVLVSSAVNAGTLYTNAVYNEKGVATPGTAATAKTGITKVSNEVLGFGTKGYDYSAYVVNSDAKIFKVDSNGVIDVVDGAANVTNDATANVWYILNASNQVIYVVIEEMDSVALLVDGVVVNDSDLSISGNVVTAAAGKTNLDGFIAALGGSSVVTTLSGNGTATNPAYLSVKGIVFVYTTATA